MMIGKCVFASMLVTSLILTANPANAENVIPVFVVQWEVDWKIKADELVGTFSSELMDSLAPSLTGEKKEKAALELYEILHTPITWDVMGDTVVDTISKECGQDVLNAVAPYLSDSTDQGEMPKDISLRYGVCVADALDHLEAMAMYTIIGQDGGRSEELLQKYTSADD